MTSEFDPIGQPRLHKTVSHLFSETHGLLQAAIDKASEARSAGSGRSRGYASLTVVVVGLVFQSGGIFAINRLKPEISQSPLAFDSALALSESERRLVKLNLDRIAASASKISVLKERIAPAMQIDADIAAIEASAQDIEAVVLRSRRGASKDEPAAVGK